ncbi:MAG: Rrf2 family transcriptional regulator [Bacteroidales bacterium]
MLSKSTEYAIRALVFVQLQNWDHKRPGVLEIASEIEAPTAFTAKILHSLAKHKLLGSMKGRGGGFFFHENHSDLTLYDVILVMEGDDLFTRCGIGLKNCSDENPCPLHDTYIEVRDSLYRVVKSESINSLASRVLEGSAVLNRATIQTNIL